jgi:hypothetical protein
MRFSVMCSDPRTTRGIVGCQMSGMKMRHPEARAKRMYQCSYAVLGLGMP